MRNKRIIENNLKEQKCNIHQISFSLISWITFFLCPLFSLPIILIGIWNGKKISVYQLILFFALLAYLYPPTSDLYRYYNNYFRNFYGINYLEIFNFYIFDFGWYSVLYIIANLKLPFQTSLVISCVIQLYITYFLINRLLSVKELSRKENFYVLIGSFILNGFWTSLESRYALSLSLFALSAFFLSKRKITSFLVTIILTSIIHFSFIFMSLILIVGYRLRNKISILSCSIVGIIIFILYQAVGLYLESIGMVKSVYLTSEDSWIDNASPLLRFFYVWVRSIPLIIMGLYILKCNNTNPYKKLTLIFLTFVFATFTLSSLNPRFKAISLLFMWMTFISTIKRSQLKWIKIFLITSIFSFFINSITAYRALSLGRYEDIIFPVPYILYCDQYNDNWIQSHIDDGSIYKID